MEMDTGLGLTSFFPLNQLYEVILPNAVLCPNDRWDIRAEVEVQLKDPFQWCRRLFEREGCIHLGAQKNPRSCSL